MVLYEWLPASKSIILEKPHKPGEHRVLQEPHLNPDGAANRLTSLRYLHRPESFS